MNLLLAVGFLGLTGALVAAHRNPATGYELSIYAATPAEFWVGIGVAALCSLLVSFSTASGRSRFVGVILGGLASTAVVALPILRGYYFHGIHDSVTHVGLARELASGSMMPYDLLYPGIHSVAAFINGLAGFTLWQSMLFVPLVAVLAFYVFVPLVVREIVDGDMAMTAGAFSAFLLVPTHLIANTTHAHPSSQTILFAPLVLFLLIRYLRSIDPSSRSGVLSSTGLALLLVVFATVLYHPQQALNVVTLLGAVSLIQYVASRTRSITFARHQTVYSVTGVALLVYAGWVLQSPGVFAVIEGAVASVRGYLVGSAPSAGSSVATQATALQAIDTSLTVVFLKLFLVSTVYVGLTGLVVIAAFGDRFRESAVNVDTTSTIRYLGVGLVAMLPVFFLYLFGDVATHYFRQAGFMMMVGTILGAVGITYAANVLSTGQLGTGFRVAMIGGFAIMLLLSGAVIHNSPFVHKANQHVTDARVSGYQTAFDVTDDSAWMAGVRQEPKRYHEALVSMNANGRRDGHVDSSELHRLQDRRSESWYMMITQNTYERELEAYRGYRYSEEDFEAVESQVDVNLVHSNGDASLYHVA